MPAVSEDYVGCEDFLEFLETFFDWRTEVWKKTVSKGFHSNRFVPHAVQEDVRAALGLFGSRWIGTQYEPVEFDALGMLDHLQNCGTAADLDVVAVRAKTEHAFDATQIARNHFLISC